MSKKNIKLANALDEYENIVLTIMQIEAQIKLLNLKHERLCEKLEHIITDDLDGRYELTTIYDQLMEV